MEKFTSRFAAAVYVSQGVFTEDRDLRLYLRVGKRDIKMVIPVGRKRLTRASVVLANAVLVLAIATGELSSLSSFFVAWFALVNLFMWAVTW